MLLVKKCPQRQRCIKTRSSRLRAELCKSSGIPSAGWRALLLTSTNNTQFLCLYSCLFTPCIIRQAAEEPGVLCGSAGL